MAVDINATRRQRVLDSLATGASRTFSRTLGGVAYSCTLANPLIRTLNGMQVLTVDVSLTRNGVLVYEDRLNQPNPPNGIYQNNGSIQDNPLQALRNTILDVASAATNNWTTPHLMRGPDGQFKGDTLAVRSGTADGRLQSSNNTWNLARDGSGLTVDTAAATVSIVASFSSTYTIRAFYLSFDTSSLGAGAVISTSVFTLYGTGTAENVTNAPVAQIRPKAWGPTLETTDWIDFNPDTNWTGLTLMADKTVSTWNETDGAANDFTHRSSADINKTGPTEVVVALDKAASATAPTGANSFSTYTADQTGTTTDPLLTVTYTPARSMPVFNNRPWRIWKAR